MCDTYCVVHPLVNGTMRLAVDGDTGLRGVCPVQCSRVRKQERPGSEPFSSSSIGPPVDSDSGKPVSNHGPNSPPRHVLLGLDTAYTTAQVFIFLENWTFWPQKLTHPRVKSWQELGTDTPFHTACCYPHLPGPRPGLLCPLRGSEYSPQIHIQPWQSQG